MTQDSVPPRPKYRPGPKKGGSRILGETGRTHRDILLETGYALAKEGVRPTIDAVRARQPLLTNGYIKANSRLLEPCREAFRRLSDLHDQSQASSPSPRETELTPIPEFARVTLLAERREARALEELANERLAHAHTKAKLREAEAVIERLLAGYAAED